MRFWSAALVVALAAGGPASAAAGPLAALLGKIKHVVVLMEENRSFDHFFGFAAKKLGVDGLSGHEFNYVNVSDPGRGKVTVGPNAKYVNPCDPNHGTPATATKMAGGMGGFVSYENDHGHGGPTLDYCSVMSGFAPAAIPVITALAAEYAVMDKMFCSHPGPTWPNRMFALSATSHGSTETGCFYDADPGKLFPQRLFFDQLAEADLSWKNYYNDTPWELFLETIAHNPEHVAPLTQFYADAAAGTLPSYAWINPRAGMNVSTGEGSNDQHPDHDVALGEALIKDVYEAVRASPQWNETLFIITYDEHGGFYDHVVPPNAPNPGGAGAGGPSYPDAGYNFTQLGVRIPTVLVSPWIERGTVVSEPPAAQRPANDSQYDLTSIMATARKLLGMPATPLTKRDAWAGTFEHVLSRSAPRGDADCPAHLPAAPTATLHPLAEGAQPLNHLQREIAEVHAHVIGGANATADADAIGNRPQRDVSGWLQERYATHAANTAAWKASKAADAGLTVMARPPAMAGWKAMFEISFEDGVQVQTINAPKRKLVGVGGLADTAAQAFDGGDGGGGGAYCLDWHTAGQNTASHKTPEAPVYDSSAVSIGISDCYPSAKPRTNRDKDQQWVTKPDATIRPAQRPDLCLTNVRLDAATTMEVYNVTVAVCDGRVEQHWAVGTQRDGISSISFATEVSVGLV